ncbi:MAG: Pycsar system effector family protein [Fidelibacterota bacterium]
MTTKQPTAKGTPTGTAPIFQILASEQQILQRTDQKAFTLMSILGVFMVFFIVHFLKVQMDWFKFIMVIVYFLSALVAIINLVMVIVPRIRKEEPSGETSEVNATFFSGISQFKSPADYADYLEDISSDSQKIYQMFATQLYALGQINAYKNKALKRAIVFFATAIISELLIIMSMTWARALPYLFPH